MQQPYFEEAPSKGFDSKRYFGKLGKNYYWLLLTTALLVGGAYAYLHYTTPLYKVSSSVLIKHPNDAANKLGSPFKQGGGEAEESGQDIKNEIFKLQSAALVGKVVDSLRFDIQASKVEDQKMLPLRLEDLPVGVSLKKKDPENESPKYKLQLFKDYYTLTEGQKEVKGTYGEPLQLGSDQLVLTKEKQFADGAQYTFQYHGRSNTITNYLSRLTVAPIPKGGQGMLNVSVKDEVAERAHAFIGALIHHFDISNLDYNNQALRKEMAFLNERLNAVTAELDAQARMVKNFKASKRVFDVSASASQLLGSLPQIDSRKADIYLKRDLVNLVESNIRSYDGGEEIVPNSSGLQDPVMSDQINKYNQLVLQKRAVLDNGTSQDPRLPAINGQLQQLRSNILKNITNIKNEIKANTSSLAAQERSITGRFSTIPAKEKELIELTRVLEIKQSLYTFLLQKKEDKEMELASAEVAESRILDEGLGKVERIPNPLHLYGIALLAGLLLPALVLLIKVLANKRIETRQDIESETMLPIAGEIGYVHKKNMEVVISPTISSPEAEQFRTLRSNTSYLTKGLKNKVILVTSSTTREGKSFVSLNLANSIAIGNRKTVLVEFDLRNPGLSVKLGYGQTVGLSNYLSGEVDVRDIIQPSADSPNLSFISYGSEIPVNAGELILSDKMQDLFQYLKLQFDVVVVDCPPVGPVSDALILARWADLSFFVLRHKITQRATLKLVNKLHQEQKLPHLALIINGIKDNREFSYGNDFGYGYGYGAKQQARKETIIAN